MKEKLLIIGAGGLGRMTLDIASPKYECAFVDDAFDVGHKICGINVVGSTNDLPQLKNYYNLFIVAIGDNVIRKKITLLCLSLGYTNISIISNLAYISDWSSVGDGCIVFPFAAIQNGAKVGKCNVLCSFVEAHHDSTIGDFSVFYPSTVIRTCAVVGDNVKCGSNVSIGNYAVIENGTILENGSSIFARRNKQ